jgi:hypothetical protein
MVTVRVHCAHGYEVTNCAAMYHCHTSDWGIVQTPADRGLVVGYLGSRDLPMIDRLNFCISNILRSHAAYSRVTFVRCIVA